MLKGAREEGGQLTNAHTLRAPRAAAPFWSTRQLLRLALSAILPRPVLMVRGSRRSATVCLTFDDGPDSRFTPQVLDVLRDAGVKATFFVTGSRIKEHPDVLRRTVQEGHAVGHHSYWHSDPNLTSSRQLLAEIKQTQDLFEQIVGRSTKLVRPPHGKLTAQKLWALWNHGMTTVLWNQDPKDYAASDEAELVQWVRATLFRPGDVVLLHDTNPHTPAVLPELIRAVRGGGMALNTINEMLGIGTPAGLGGRP